MLDLKDCIEKGLIKKIPPSKEQAHLSSQKASELLEEAKANLEEERHNSAALVGYVAAFNAARALLFKDGYREKSHYCVARYLEVHYSEKLGSGMIYSLDTYRETRHEIQYSSTHSASEMEAKEMVRFAEELIEKVDEILQED